VAAIRRRLPGVDVRRAAAEELPFDDDLFDAAIAQLVVHFMADPIKGIGEMARVTRRGGLVVAAVWDHNGGRGPVSLFWEAARSLDPGATNESGLAGARRGHLAELFERAGLDDIEDGELMVRREHPTFEDWWEPYMAGVGPAGAYTAKLDPAARDRLRDRCRQLLPTAPFTLESVAWTARGTA
jgi:SAM-dependent methyltransferase